MIIKQKKCGLLLIKRLKKQGISIKDIGDTLKRPIFMVIPEDTLTVSMAIDQGVPVVLGNGRKQPVAEAINKLAEKIATELSVESDNDSNGTGKDTETSGLFGKLFGKR
ncbi:MAG: hypothetical protein M5U34_22075 [Chloroflexi bacterium]|nr:hypothetical protein [Chloroflexota bacterium]